MLDLLFLIFLLFALVAPHPLHRLDDLSHGKVTVTSDAQPALELHCTIGHGACNRELKLQSCESGTACVAVLDARNVTFTPQKPKGSMKHKPMMHKSKKAISSAAQNGSVADAQTSLTLDPAVIAKGFASNGLDSPGSDTGQVAALTSTNNFINFCKTVDLPITNGQQLRNGSCNPAPMGVLPSTKKMPSSKFIFPKNGVTIKAKQTFTIQMAVKNLETGNFVNPDTNYLAAPQQVNKRGMIIGHSHVVIEKLTSLDQTAPTNPNHFAFFKGLNNKAEKDILSVDVTGGLPKGAYRLSSINSAATHQPVLVPIAQRGALDDMIYFTVQ